MSAAGFISQFLATLHADAPRDDFSNDESHACLKCPKLNMGPSINSQGNLHSSLRLTPQQYV